MTIKKLLLIAGSIALTACFDPLATSAPCEYAGHGDELWTFPSASCPTRASR